MFKDSIIGNTLCVLSMNAGQRLMSSWINFIIHESTSLHDVIGLVPYFFFEKMIRYKVNGVM